MSEDVIPELPGPDASTYWNGEPCEARQVIVTVADAPEFELYWARHLVGTERKAVEVTYRGQMFYLDDEGYDERDEVKEYLRSMGRPFRDHVGNDGWGWAKVTLGLGSPQYGHGSLEVSEVRDREPVRREVPRG